MGLLRSSLSHGLGLWTWTSSRLTWTARAATSLVITVAAAPPGHERRSGGRTRPWSGGDVLRVGMDGDSNDILAAAVGGDTGKVLGTNGGGSVLGTDVDALRGSWIWGCTPGWVGGPKIRPIASSLGPHSGRGLTGRQRLFRLHRPDGCALDPRWPK